MICITLQYNKKGGVSLLYGPETPAKEQREKVQALKVKGLADGIDSIEVWSRADGRIKKAAVSEKEMKAAKAEAKKADDKAKKADDKKAK